MWAPTAFTDISELASAIRFRVVDAPRYIGIEGFMGSGKSSCGESLAGLLGGMLIDPDDYAERDRPVGEYLAKLDLQRLADDLGGAGKKFPFVFVTSICLRDIESAISVRMSSRVYVKGIADSGLWHAGDSLKEYEEESIVPDDWIERCVLEYHARTRPHENSDFYFEHPELPADLPV